MVSDLPLPDEKKLLIIYRVESGCLGPDGAQLVDRFCEFAQKKFASEHSGIIRWNILPRNSKTLPEIEYNVLGKKITHSQAERYLLFFDKNLGGLEGYLSESIAKYIEAFMSRS
ncbi:hypothetical protein SAMN03080615_03505 [Amphritea atlantica]|uniref:Uncharacterized protein n=1 Tax=Amphritea atlantica TaxID=355243 RepID=A0A1H9KI70_9GAMM|nr:hypothetical protein [Amphritea atlantica]SEQ98635.1 hypothetical protein SAMN03080615_03505 [Amphritea atlantica]